MKLYISLHWVSIDNFCTLIAVEVYKYPAEILILRYNLNSGSTKFLHFQTSADSFYSRHNSAIHHKTCAQLLLLRFNLTFIREKLQDTNSICTGLNQMSLLVAFQHISQVFHSIQKFLFSHFFLFYLKITCYHIKRNIRSLPTTRKMEVGKGKEREWERKETLAVNRSLFQ